MEKIKQYSITLAVLVVACLVAFGAGYWSRKPETITKIETQIVEKIVEKKIYIKDNSKTDTIETKPDGTVVHTVTQNDVTVAASDTQVDTSISEKKEETKVITELPKYAIGVMAESATKWPLKPTTEIIAGYRIFGTLWLDGSYNPSSSISGVGLRWEIK